MNDNVFVKLIRNLFKDKHFKELSKGTISALLLKLLGLFFGFLYTLIIAKVFGSEVLGNFVLSGILISFLSILSVLGFDNTLLAFSSQNLTSKDKTQNTNLIFNAYIVVVPFSILLSFGLYYSSGFLSKFLFHNPNLINVIEVSSGCIIPFSILKLNSQFLRGHKKINQYVFFTLVSLYLVSTIILFFAKDYFKSELVVIYSFVIAVYLTCILSIISSLKYLDFTFGNFKMDFKKYFFYSHPIIYSDLLKSLKQWIGPLLLGYFLFESEVGVFTVIFKFASVSSIIIYSVNSLAMPKYGELYGINDRDGLQRTLNASSKLAFWLSLPVIFFVLVFSKILLKNLGSDFSYSFIPLLILSLGQLAECLSASSNYFLQMVEHQKKYFSIVLISTSIIFVLSLVLAPYLEINGVAIAYTFGSIIQVILTIIYIKKNMGLTAFYKPINSLKKLWSN